MSNLRKNIKFIFWLATFFIFVDIFLVFLQSSYGPNTTLLQRVISVFYRNNFGQILLLIAAITGITDLFLKAKTSLKND